MVRQMYKVHLLRVNSVVYLCEKEEQEKENVSFKKIVNEQVLAKDEAITEKVIKVIKEKPEIVRDTEEKRNHSW